MHRTGRVKKGLKRDKNMVFPYTSTKSVDTYLLKVNNRNSRKRCEICSKLTIVFLVFLLLTLNK